MRSSGPLAERTLPAGHRHSARPASGSRAWCAGGPRRDRGSRRSSCADAALPYGEGITYWPVAEAVRRVAAISDEARAGGGQTPDRGAPRRASSAPIASRMVVAELIGLGEGAARTAGGGFLGRPSILRGARAKAAARPRSSTISTGAEETFLDLLGYIVESDERRSGARRSAWPGRSCSTAVPGGRAPTS